MMHTRRLGTLDVHLTADDLARLAAVFPPGAAASPRYAAPMMAVVNR